jgi:hypothetical protein
MNKIVALKVESFTPELLLFQMLHKIPDIDSIAIVWKGKDKVLNAATSHMEVETLAVLAKRLDMCLESHLYEDEDF